jgi:hypothetical protein
MLNGREALVVYAVLLHIVLFCLLGLVPAPTGRQRALSTFEASVLVNQTITPALDELSIKVLPLPEILYDVVTESVEASPPSVLQPELIEISKSEKLLPQTLNALPVLPIFSASAKGFTTTSQQSSAMNGVGRESGGRIGNLEIKAQRLCVLLDVSGSMQSKLAALRQEIKSVFVDAVFIEMEGAYVVSATQLEESRANFKGKKRAIGIVEALGQHEQEASGCDALYIFSDFRDMVTSEGVAELQEATHARLYLHSVGENPADTLLELCVKSGGAYVVPQP